MKYNSYAKYVPITEDEFRVFKEQQRKELKFGKEELSLPVALQPLVAAQNEKIHTLFEPSRNPDLQEQRLAHLTTIINGLRQKVEEQQRPFPSVPPNTPQVKTGVAPTFAPKREDVLMATLGDDMWNAAGELVIDGVAVPNSNKKHLLNYAASNWSTKYLRKAPEGGAQFLDLMTKKNIPLHLLNSKLRGQVHQPTPKKPKPQGQLTPGASQPGSSTVQGLAFRSPRKKRQCRGDDAAEGLAVLSSGKKFAELMRQK